MSNFVMDLIFIVLVTGQTLTTLRVNQLENLRILKDFVKNAKRKK
jgi:hypothetical protein